MKLTFFITPLVWHDDVEVSPQILASQDRVVLAEDELGKYLDKGIADFGVVGGTIYLSAHAGSGRLEVSYWLPTGITDEMLKSIREYTVAQFEDGLGEDGFELVVDDTLLSVYADTRASIRHEIVDDGRHVDPPSQIAIAARDGDIKKLETELSTDDDSVDRTHQGYTGLHLAILYGHFVAAKLLVSKGADPNRPDLNGFTPLELCALSRDMNDDVSCQLTKVLLESGADPKHVVSGDETAMTLAISRQKPNMAEVLSAHC